MSRKPHPPPYEHHYPEHPGSGCEGCTPLSRELDWLRAENEKLRRLLRTVNRRLAAQPRLANGKLADKELRWLDEAAALAGEVRP